jgi:hypothetical protein
LQWERDINEVEIEVEVEVEVEVSRSGAKFVEIPHNIVTFRLLDVFQIETCAQG